MTPRELKKLLGGYAAGTLDPQQREALLRAALEDQALFDALADEEALRDLLSDPAARLRLMEALDAIEPPAARGIAPGTGGWLQGLRVFLWRPLPLSLAGSLAVALIAFFSITYTTRQPVADVAPADAPGEIATVREMPHAASDQPSRQRRVAPAAQQPGASGSAAIEGRVAEPAAAPPPAGARPPGEAAPTPSAGQRQPEAGREAQQAAAAEEWKDIRPEPRPTAAPSAPVVTENKPVVEGSLRTPSPEPVAEAAQSGQPRLEGEPGVAAANEARPLAPSPPPAARDERAKSTKSIGRAVAALQSAPHYATPAGMAAPVEYRLERGNSDGTYSLVAAGAMLERSDMLRLVVVARQAGTLRVTLRSAGTASGGQERTLFASVVEAGSRHTIPVAAGAIPAGAEGTLRIDFQAVPAASSPASRAADVTAMRKVEAPEGDTAKAPADPGKGGDGASYQIRLRYR